MRMIYTRHSFDGHTSWAAPTCIFLRTERKKRLRLSWGYNKFHHSLGMKAVYQLGDLDWWGGDAIVNIILLY